MTNTRWVFEPGVTLNARDSSAPNLLSARGSAGPMVALGANADRGDSSLTFAAPHGLAAGDWFLLTSQRACSHPDAGTWQLGTTTGNGAHCFFAEPCQVASVTDHVTVTLQTPLIFPGYRTDRSEETLPAAEGRPDFAHMRKVTWATANIKGFPKVLARDTTANALRWVWTKDAYAEVDFDFGTPPGIGVNVQNSYNPMVRSRSQRDRRWNSTEMPIFNTYKYISSWYGGFTVEEYHGSQCIDQTYAPISGDIASFSVCCIWPEFDIKAHYAHYQGMTTHGNSYGVRARVLAICPRGAAITNRARFADLDVTCIGEAGNDAPAVSINEFGGQDLTLKLSSQDNYMGVEFTRSITSITDSPRSIRANITGRIVNPILSAIVFRYPASTSTDVPNQIRFHNLKLVNVNAAVKSVGWWHGLHFDGVDVTVNPDSTETYLFDLGDNSAWNTARNINILGGSIPVLFKYPTIDNSALLSNVQLSWDIDWASVNTVNNTSMAVSQGYSGYPATAVAQRAIQNRWFNRVVSLNLSNNESARTLTLIAGYDHAMPVGAYIEFVNRAAVTLIVAAGTGITIAGASGEIPIVNRVIKVYRAAASVYVVSATA
ncbi:hypothetical protein BPNSA17_34100 [Bordetella petrii]